MYLTRIILNPNLVETQRLLSNRHFVHGLVNSCFNTAVDTKPLWKLSAQRRDPELYILSENEPDTIHLLGKYTRNSDSSITTKSYEPIISEIEKGGVYKIQIDANPVQRINKTQKIVPLIISTDIEKWISKQGDNHGFEILGEVEIYPKPEVLVRKGRVKITISNCQLNGIVKVSDPEKFKNFAKYGLGKNKAYGFGMPFLAKLK